MIAALYNHTGLVRLLANRGAHLEAKNLVITPQLQCGCVAACLCGCVAVPLRDRGRSVRRP